MVTFIIYSLGIYAAISFLYVYQFLYLQNDFGLSVCDYMNTEGRKTINLKFGAFVAFVAIDACIERQT